jgi:hypothetical protein
MTSEISLVLKQETDLQIHGHSTIVSLMVKGLVNSLEITKVKPLFGSFLHVYTNSSDSRHLRSSEGERFLPNSPTLAPRGSGLTPFPRTTLRISVKNVTLGTSECTNVPCETRNGHLETPS